MKKKMTPRGAVRIFNKYQMSQYEPGIDEEAFCEHILNGYYPFRMGYGWDDFNHKGKKIRLKEFRDTIKRLTEIADGLEAMR